MHRPASELAEIVSESVWLRLGQGMARCLGVSRRHRARRRGGGRLRAPRIPDYTANVLWTQGLGLMHLARIGVGVRSLAPGVPGLFNVEPERVVRTCVASALALLQPA